METTRNSQLFFKCSYIDKQLLILLNKKIKEITDIDSYIPFNSLEFPNIDKAIEIILDSIDNEEKSIYDILQGKNVKPIDLFTYYSIFGSKKTNRAWRNVRGNKVKHLKF